MWKADREVNFGRCAHKLKEKALDLNFSDSKFGKKEKRAVKVLVMSYRPQSPCLNT